MKNYIILYFLLKNKNMDNYDFSNLDKTELIKVKNGPKANLVKIKSKFILSKIFGHFKKEISLRIINIIKMFKQD